MGIVDPTIKQKIEKKEQISIDDDKKQDQAGYENSLMKKVKINYEFINEQEKRRKKIKKATKKELKKECVNIMVEKKTFQKPSKSQKNNMGDTEFISKVNVENLMKKIKKHHHHQNNQQNKKN